jgi:hypothetical protein
MASPAHVDDPARSAHNHLRASLQPFELLQLPNATKDRLDVDPITFGEFLGFHMDLSRELSSRGEDQGDRTVVLDEFWG